MATGRNCQNHWKLSEFHCRVLPLDCLFSGSGSPPAKPEGRIGEFPSQQDPQQQQVSQSRRRSPTPRICHRVILVSVVLLLVRRLGYGDGCCVCFHVSQSIESLVVEAGRSTVFSKRKPNPRFHRNSSQPRQRPTKGYPGLILSSPNPKPIKRVPLPCPPIQVQEIMIASGR